MSHSCDEYYTVYIKKARKARKSHVCDACERTIKPKSYYMDIRTVFDGRAETIKRCGSCEVTHRHLIKLCQELADGELWPDEKLGCGLDYKEEWGDAPPLEIARLPMLSDVEAGQLLAPKVDHA